MRTERDPSISHPFTAAPGTRHSRCSASTVAYVGLVDQNWLERDLSALLLRMLVVGRRQQSESIEVALDME